MHEQNLKTLEVILIYFSSYFNGSVIGLQNEVCNAGVLIHVTCRYVTVVTSQLNFRFHVQCNSNSDPIIF